jgi:hypothetical protein
LIRHRGNQNGQRIRNAGNGLVIERMNGALEDSYGLACRCPEDPMATGGRMEVDGPLVTRWSTALYPAALDHAIDQLADRGALYAQCIGQVRRRDAWLLANDIQRPVDGN